MTNEKCGAPAGIFEAKGLSVHVSFCPERIVQGQSIRELRELPHIISSFSDEGRSFCASLFSKLCDKVVHVGVREAELAKLFNNSWRYITFAVANQFYMMAESSGADIREVYRAITQDYARGKNIPKPGFAAGPCLLKDTMQLAYHGAEVLCTDEYVPADDLLPLETVLEQADLFVIGMPHQRYRDLQFPKGKPVFNIWNLDSASRV